MAPGFDSVLFFWVLMKPLFKQPSLIRGKAQLGSFAILPRLGSPFMIEMKEL
jgi:hypothetical protein